MHPEPHSAIDHALQTEISDPGRFAHLIDGIEPSIAAVSAIARNIVVHYRASGHELPTSSRGDISLRWAEAIFDRDQQRHPKPLGDQRAVVDRVQGCCRDHTLVAISILRHHGIPARSRVGFCSYFSNSWHHDHVIVEVWRDGRWRRFDPEVEGPTPLLVDPTDIPHGPNSPFLTAAQVWTGHRAGTLDVNRFGVDEGLGIDGDWFAHSYVIREVAHRFGDELLLWDLWGAMHDDLADAPFRDLELVDAVAALLLRADAGVIEAERELLGLYRGSDGLRPRSPIKSLSPNGGTFQVNLETRTETKTGWSD